MERENFGSKLGAVLAAADTQRTLRGVLTAVSRIPGRSRPIRTRASKKHACGKNSCGC